jgi:cell wall-associated NlpC family hydrolase
MNETITVNEIHPLYGIIAELNGKDRAYTALQSEFESFTTALQAEYSDYRTKAERVQNDLLAQVKAYQAAQWMAVAARVLTAATVCQTMRVPYLFGGEWENDRAFDCSSLTQFSFRHASIVLPRTSRQQATIGVEVAVDNVRAGDLLLFDPDGDGVISHVGIKAFDGDMMIHTANKTEGIATVDWKTRYGPGKLVTVRRVINV